MCDVVGRPAHQCPRAGAASLVLRRAPALPTHADAEAGGGVRRLAQRGGGRLFQGPGVGRTCGPPAKGGGPAMPEGAPVPTASSAGQALAPGPMRTPTRLATGQRKPLDLRVDEQAVYWIASGSLLTNESTSVKEPWSRIASARLIPLQRRLTGDPIPALSQIHLDGGGHDNGGGILIHRRRRSPLEMERSTSRAWAHRRESSRRAVDSSDHRCRCGSRASPSDRGSPR